MSPVDPALGSATARGIPARSRVVVRAWREEPEEGYHSRLAFRGLRGDLLELDRIIITGARQHNLKHVTVEIPKKRLVVLTGVSGSGKSSLAFDTLYAEGQRRYIESLSAYARQFLGQMDKPPQHPHLLQSSLCSWPDATHSPWRQRSPQARLSIPPDSPPWPS